MNQAEKELGTKKIELAEIEVLKQHVPGWREVFEQASPAKKKMMLSTLINNIHVHRDRIEIDFKLRINQFIGTMDMASINNIDTCKVLSHHSFAANN